MIGKNDIRYVAKCYKCKAAIGDWALRIPKEERLCWNCKPHTVKDITKAYGKKND